MTKYPVIYRVMHFDSPVAIRPELKETEVPHADNLRYDQGFHHPSDPSLVIFPLFRHSHNGSYPDQITGPRWRSYGMRFERVAALGVQMSEAEEGKLPEGVTPYGIRNLDEWVGFVSEPPQYKRRPVTLAEYKSLNPKLKIVGYRQIP